MLKFFLIVYIGLACNNKLVIGQQDTIRTEVNDTFLIELPSSVATGYGWELADSLDKQMISMISKSYREGKADEDGNTGTETFSFVAKAKGETSVVLKYVRPWKMEDIKKKKTYKIVIK